MTSTSSASAAAAPTKDRASCGAPGAPQSFAQRWLQPRYLIVLLITLILVTGQIEYAILRSYSVLAICLGTAIVTEVALSKPCAANGRTCRAPTSAESARRS